MTTVYLVRHAQAEGNLYRIAQGQDNSNLTDRGWRQVRALERRFADIHIDAVYSSDLYRTCATASAIYKPKGLPLHRVPALREVCVGEWERRTWGDIYRYWPEQMEYFSHNPVKWHVAGAERPQQVLERVLAAVRTIAAENDGKTVVLVSHGYAIRLLLAKLQGCPIEQIDKSPTGDNTAVSCLEVDGDEMRVVFRDDNSHLKTPEYLAGEKIRRRAIALEIGLYFEPLRLPEQAELFLALVKEGWNDAGETRPFDEEALLRGAAEGNTLVAYRGGDPVGLVQFGRELGWISLLCIRGDSRRQSLGVQLIGQAVMHWRPQGAQKLRIALPAGCAGESFFAEHGFAVTERMADGRMVLEKDIRLDPEFLGGSAE